MDREISMICKEREQDHTFPALKASFLVGLVKRWDIPSAQLLEGLNLDEGRFEDPSYRLSVQTFCALVDRARALTGEPGLGFYMGLFRRLSTFDTLAFTAATSRTLRGAVEAFVNTAPLITTAITYRLNVQGDTAALIIEENVDLGSMRDYVLFSVLTIFWPITRFLTRRNLNETIDLAIPKPPYYARFAHLMPETRFNQPTNQIVFNASLLEAPLFAPDTAAQKAERDQCERELQALGFGRAVVDRARNILHKPGGFRTLKEVATELHMSPRTLKRQLAAKQLSFSQLLEQERRNNAMLLLRSSANTLQEVTEFVGYSTVPNFIRAFRRWTGKTPAEYRRHIKREVLAQQTNN